MLCLLKDVHSYIDDLLICIAMILCYCSHVHTLSPQSGKGYTLGPLNILFHGYLLDFIQAIFGNEVCQTLKKEATPKTITKNKKPQILLE